jgi:antitoxin component HigA of HigAB toxin-antitoxin module
MSIPLLDECQYRKLLDETLPVAIRTEEEYHRLLATAAALMEKPEGEKNMKPSDLWTVLPKSRVSEILNGKRSISKTQAKQLAELLRVPVDLFVWRRVCARPATASRSTPPQRY